MALVNADRVKETTVTTGTGTLTLGGAVTGFQSFSAIGDGNTAYCCCYAVDANGIPTGQWEVFLGTYTASGTTLARTTLIASSTGSAVNFSAGTKHVIVCYPSQGTIIARQPGGVAGTDEVQIYHDGDNGFLHTKSGDLRFQSNTFRWTRDSDGVGLASLSNISEFILNGGKIYLTTNGNNGFKREDDNTTSIIGGGTDALRDLLMRKLIVRQDGGVAGTDDVEIYHDGTNGYIDANSGALRLTGGSPYFTVEMLREHKMYSGDDWSGSALFFNDSSNGKLRFTTAF